MSLIHYFIFGASIIVPAIYGITMVFFPNRASWLSSYYLSLMVFLIPILVSAIALMGVDSFFSPLALSLNFLKIPSQFELQFLLNEESVCWILGSSLLLFFGTLAFPDFYKEKNRVSRFPVLLCLFIFSNLSILITTMVPVLVFVELLIFLAYFLGMRAEGKMSHGVEMLDFFKQKIFVFLVIFLVFILSFEEIFSIWNFMNGGLLLYIITVISFRSKYISWFDHLPQVLLFLACFALQRKAIGTGLDDIYLGVYSYLLAIFSIFCAVRALLASKGTHSIKNYILSVLSLNLIFLIHFSPDNAINIAFAICLVLLSLQCICLTLSNVKLRGAQRKIPLLVASIAHLIIVGFPGSALFLFFNRIGSVDLALFILLCLQSLLLTGVFSRLLLTTGDDEEFWKIDRQIPSKDISVYLGIFILLVGNEPLMRGTLLEWVYSGTNGILPTMTGESSSIMLYTAASIVFLTVIGFFLGGGLAKSQKFSLYLSRKREILESEGVPYMYNILDKVNIFVFHIQSSILTASQKKILVFLDFVSKKINCLDGTVIMNVLLNGSAVLAHSLSHFVQRVQNSAARAYLFFSVFFILTMVVLLILTG